MDMATLKKAMPRMKRAERGIMQKCNSSAWLLDQTNTTVLRPLFPGPPGGARARRELLDFMVQGRHIDHQAGRHSLRTNHCPPPPSPIRYKNASIRWQDNALPISGYWPTSEPNAG